MTDLAISDFAPLGNNVIDDFPGLLMLSMPDRAPFERHSGRMSAFLISVGPFGSLLGSPLLKPDMRSL